MGNFPYQTKEELQLEIEKLGLDIIYSTNTSILFDSKDFSCRGVNYSIPNRFTIHPMEGYDATDTGDPTELTLRRYERYGHAGAGIVWFEAVAVTNEGRSSPHQLYLNVKNIKKFSDLISHFTNSRLQLLKKNEDLPQEIFGRPLKILQLTHSGRYSKPMDIKYPLRACENFELDQVMHINPERGEIVSDPYLESLQDAFLEAIGLAEEVGFDGVDIKSCHGYLISELLGSYSRRNSKYGGETLRNRQKFLLDVIKKATREFPQLLFTVRLNLFDALPYPYGMGTKEIDSDGNPRIIDLNELHQLLKHLQFLGIRLVSFTAGNPNYKPYLSRPFIQNAFKGKDAPEHSLYSIYRILSCLREISKNHPNLISIGTAFTWFQQFLPNFAAGEIQRNSFQCIGYGRMAFSYPDFPIDLFKKGFINPKKVCITCSKCTELMRMGNATGCVVRDKIYAELYRNTYAEYGKKNPI